MWSPKVIDFVLVQRVIFDAAYVRSTPDFNAALVCFDFVSDWALCSGDETQMQPRNLKAACRSPRHFNVGFPSLSQPSSHPQDLRLRHSPRLAHFRRCGRPHLPCHCSTTTSAATLRRPASSPKLPANVTVDAFLLQRKVSERPFSMWTAVSSEQNVDLRCKPSSGLVALRVNGTSCLKVKLVAKALVSLRQPDAAAQRTGGVAWPMALSSFKGHFLVTCWTAQTDEKTKRKHTEVCIPCLLVMLSNSLIRASVTLRKGRVVGFASFPPRVALRTRAMGTDQSKMGGYGEKGGGGGWALRGASRRPPRQLDPNTAVASNEGMPDVPPAFLARFSQALLQQMKTDIGDLQALASLIVGDHYKATGKTIDEAKNDEGLTALHAAVLAEKPQVVKFLLECGCQPRTLSKTWQTALHDAILKGNHDIVLLLLEFGAPNVCLSTNSSGELPLHTVRPLWSAFFAGYTSHMMVTSFFTLKDSLVNVL